MNTVSVFVTDKTIWGLSRLRVEKGSPEPYIQAYTYELRVLRGKVVASDPVRPRYLLPRPVPDPKVVNVMAPTTDRLDYILPGPDRTGPKQFIIIPKSIRFRLQHTREYALQ